jgi:hypothetical protein
VKLFAETHGTSIGVANVNTRRITHWRREVDENRQARRYLTILGHPRESVDEPKNRKTVDLQFSGSPDQSAIWSLAWQPSWFITGSDVSGESSCAGAKTLLRRFMKAGVSGNQKTHGRTRSGFPELIEAFKHLQECLLRHLFRILALAAHQLTVMENFSPKRYNEAVERICISRRSCRARSASAARSNGKYRFNCNEMSN